MKKRILSSILAATVAVSGLCLASVTVSAATTEADAEYAFSISLDKEELKAGDTVVATINLNKNAGCIGIRFSVNFNEDVLEVYSREEDGLYYHNATNGEVFPDGAFTGLDLFTDELTSPFLMLWLDSLQVKNNTSTGVLGTMTFIVKDDVKPGTYDNIISGEVGAIIYAQGATAIPKDGSTSYVADGPSAKVVCTEHVWSDWTEDNATCNEGGKQTRTCTVCGEVEEKTTEALGHDFGEWDTTKEATCTEDGSRERVCSRCGEKETEVITALGHDVTEWTVDKEATCTEDGSQSGVCSRCNETITEAIPATGHQWGEWTVVKPATETEVGTEERVCSVCNEKETREIPVLEPAVSEDDPTSSETEPSGTNAPAPGTDNEDDKGSPDTGVLPVATTVVVMAAVSGAIAVISKKRK